MPSKEEYEQFFIDADTDKNGSLSFTELIVLLRKNGYNGTDSEIKKFFACADTDGDKSISKDEYMVAMGQQPPEVHGRASVRNCFLGFDKDGNGHIDKNELDAVFQEMGKVLSEKDIARMMELIDKDKSGSIDYEEFTEYFFGKK